MHTSLSVFMNMNYLLWCDLTGVAGLVTVLVLLLMMALEGEKKHNNNVVHTSRASAIGMRLFPIMPLLYVWACPLHPK